MKITAREARDKTNNAQEKYKKSEDSKISKFLDELRKKAELRRVYRKIKLAAAFGERSVSAKISYQETIDALERDGYHISTDPFTFFITHFYDITW